MLVASEAVAAEGLKAHIIIHRTFHCISHNSQMHKKGRSTTINVKVNVFGKSYVFWASRGLKTRPRLKSRRVKTSNVLGQDIAQYNSTNNLRFRPRYTLTAHSALQIRLKKSIMHWTNPSKLGKFGNAFQCFQTFYLLWQNKNCTVTFHNLIDIFILKRLIKD